MSETTAQQDVKNWFEDVAAGNRSLAYTFWLAGTLFPLLIFGGAIFFADMKFDGQITAAGKLWFGIISCTATAYCAFIVVAVYNSALSYAGLVVWKGLAIVLSVLSVLASGVESVQILSGTYDWEQNLGFPKLGVDTPVMVDKVTRLDNYWERDGARHAFYTITDNTHAYRIRSDVDAFAANMGPTVCNGWKRDGGITQVLTYRDNEGRQLAQLVLNAETCRGY